MSNPVFRDLRQEDLIAICKSYVETYKREPWNENWDYEIAKYRIEDMVMNSIALCYGVFIEHEFIGGIFGRRVYFINKKELFIDEFFVDWKFQLKGYGTQLLKFATNDLYNKGFSKIILNAEKRYPSYMFYERNGFTELETMSMMYKDIK
jgi:aminoglycoside 6'-N-acetyltransferase I